MSLRPLRFVVNVTPTGAVVAKAIDFTMEVTADNLAELRDRLVDELKPFGYTATLVGIRSEPVKAEA